MANRDWSHDLSNKEFEEQPSLNPLFPSAYPSQSSSSMDPFEYFKGYFEKPRDRKGGQETSSGQKASHSRHGQDQQRDRSRSPLQSSASSYHGYDRSHPKESGSRLGSKSSRSPVKDESRSQQRSDRYDCSHPLESTSRSTSKLSRSPVKEDTSSRQRSDRKTYSRSPEKKNDERKSFCDSKPEQKGETLREKSTDSFRTSEGKKERRKKDLSLFVFSEGETPTFDPYYVKPRSTASASSEPKVTKKDTTPDHFQRAPLPETDRTSLRREREIIPPVRHEPSKERSNSFSFDELEDLDLPEVPTRPISSSAQLSDVSSEKSDSDFEQDQSSRLNLGRESPHNHPRSSHHYVHQSEYDNQPRRQRVGEQHTRREVNQGAGWRRGSYERTNDPQNRRPPPSHEISRPSPSTSRKPSKRDTDKKDVGCIHCFSNAHILENCKHFLQMSIHERFDLIKNFPGTLCLACLQKGHLFKTCPRKNQCSATSPICGNPLHPLLHNCLEPNCFVCQKGEHTLQDCEMFLEMDMSARWDIVRTRKACSVCLKMNHYFNRCLYLAKCPKSKVCTNKYHPLLHTCETTGHRRNQGHADRFRKDPSVEGGNYEQNSRRSQPIEDWSHPRPHQSQNERRSYENTVHRNNEPLDGRTYDHYGAREQDHRSDLGDRYEPRYDNRPNFEEETVGDYHNDSRSFKGYDVGRSANSRNTYSHSGYDGNSQDGFDRHPYNENSRYYGREDNFDSPKLHDRGQPGGSKNDYYSGGERLQGSDHSQTSSYGRHQRGLSEGKEDEPSSHHEYKNQPRSAPKLEGEDPYSTSYRSRSQSREFYQAEGNSCRPLSATKEDPKTQKKGLDSLYTHFYRTMKKSGQDTSLAWDMVVAWRVAGHCEQSLRDLVENHQPKTRQLLENLFMSELQKIPKDIKPDVDLHHVADETIRFLESGGASS